MLNQESCNNEVENCDPSNSPKHSGDLVNMTYKPNANGSIASIITNSSSDIHSEDGEHIQQNCTNDVSPSTSSPTSSINVDTPRGTGSPCSMEESSSIPATSFPVNLQGATALPTRRSTRSTRSKSFGSMPPMAQQQGLLYSLLVASDELDDKCQSPIRHMNPVVTKSANANDIGGCNSSDNLPEATHPNGNGTHESKESGRSNHNNAGTNPPRKCPHDSMSHTISGTCGNNNQCTPLHRTKTHTTGKPPHFKPYKRFQAASFGSTSDFHSTIRGRLLFWRQFNASHDLRKHNELNQISYSPKLKNNTISEQPRAFGQGCLSAHARLQNTSQPIASTSSNLGVTNSFQSLDSGLNESPADFSMSTFPVSYSKTDSQSSGTSEPRTPDSPTGFIQLAKKTSLPVQARVTRWLRQAAEFVAVSAPLVSTMKSTLENYANSHVNNDWDSHPKLAMDTWLTLLIKCWHRLLALYMAENELELVVVEDRWGFQDMHQSNTVPVIPDLSILGLPWSLLPDMQNFGISSVRSPPRRPDQTFGNDFIQFLSAIRQAKLTVQEFVLLRNVVLMTAHEPTAITSVGLNVISISRCPPPGSESEVIKKHDPESTHILQSTEEIRELVSLAHGLSLLITICPYRMANLFCTHLHTHSSPLNNQFLLSMHSQFLKTCEETISSFIKTP